MRTATHRPAGPARRGTRRPTRRPTRRLPVILPLALLAGLARADSVVLGPARDATLIEDPSGALANGSGPHVFVGRVGAASRAIRRAAVAFDIAGAIPPGSRVTGASLTLDMSQTNAGPVGVTLHRLLAEWGEGPSSAAGGGGAASEPGDVTWIHTHYDDRLWAVPGGDFDPLPHAGAVVDGPGSYTWTTTPDLVADVQAWLDDPAAAHGWILLGDETRPTTVKRFDAREHPDPAARPRLIVEFIPPCVPRFAGTGYWRRQCLALPQEAGGQGPPWGEGPASPTEPGFTEAILPCATALLAADLPEGEGACGPLDPRRQAETCADLRRLLTTLAFNLCAGRLQTSCPIAEALKMCGVTDVGGLFATLLDRLQRGDCGPAPSCARRDADLQRTPAR